MEIPRASKYRQGFQKRQKVGKFSSNFRENEKNTATPGRPVRNTSESRGYLVPGIIIGGLIGFELGGPGGALVLACICGFVGMRI